MTLHQKEVFFFFYYTIIWASKNQHFYCSFLALFCVWEDSVLIRSTAGICKNRCMHTAKNTTFKLQFAPKFKKKKKNVHWVCSKNRNYNYSLSWITPYMLAYLMLNIMWANWCGKEWLHFPHNEKTFKTKTRLIKRRLDIFSSVENIDYRLSILYRVGCFSRLERWKVTLLIWHHSAWNSTIVIPTETHQNVFKCFFSLEFKRQKRGLNFGLEKKQNVLFSLLWSGWILVLMLLVASLLFRTS